MMQKPQLALRVADLERSVAFYAATMGFRPLADRPSADVAVVEDWQGDLMLLAGPDVSDLEPFLAEQPYIVAPGDAIHFAGGDLDARHATLEAAGLSGITLETKRWGD